MNLFEDDNKKKQLLPRNRCLLRLLKSQNRQ
nr:Uncharacterised protein [Klebsiella pneumoniae]